MNPENLHAQVSEKSDPRIMRSEVYLDLDEKLSPAEIKEKMYETKDDMEMLINDIIPDLPKLYNSQGEEIDKDNLIQTIQAVRDGYGDILTITNQYGLRTLVEGQIYAENVSKEIAKVESLNDFIMFELNELPELKRINGEIIDKSALVRVLNIILKAIEERDLETIKITLKSITQRFGLRAKIYELVSDMWYATQKVTVLEKKENIVESEPLTQEELKTEYHRLYEEYSGLKRGLQTMDEESVVDAQTEMNRIAVVLNKMIKQIKDWN